MEKLKQALFEEALYHKRQYQRCRKKNPPNPAAERKESKQMKHKKETWRKEYFYYPLVIAFLIRHPKLTMILSAVLGSLLGVLLPELLKTLL